jgi:hypothetical protein
MFNLADVSESSCMQKLTVNIMKYMNHHALQQLAIRSLTFIIFNLEATYDG